jgi:hypothetical protein
VHECRNTLRDMQSGCVLLAKYATPDDPVGISLLRYTSPRLTRSSSCTLHTWSITFMKELGLHRVEWRRRMASSGVLRRVALVRTDVSEELSASFTRVTRIGELGTTLAVTRKRRPLRRSTTTALCISSRRASVALYFFVACVRC